MAEQRAYQSVWQLRGDTWCQLEEAADQLAQPTNTRSLAERYVDICRELMARLAPLEPFWAFPGTAEFARVQRLFTAGSYGRFARAVNRINTALTTESYRSGDVVHASLDEQYGFSVDPRQLEYQDEKQHEQLYFEVLVVESMNEAQERALRKELRGLRRPDDEFVYEIVVASSGDEALMAAQVNANLQAVVIRRRFSHRSTRDLSALADFADAKISDELEDRSLRTTARRSWPPHWRACVLNWTST